MTELSQTQDLVLVRYLDHVLYHRSLALAMKPQIREAVGWLMYECEQYLTLSWDYDAEPPSLHGGDVKASGLVLLKTDILMLKKLKINLQPLQESLKWHLNSHEATETNEYAFRPSERKTQRVKRLAKS